jgi:hypothetical protein
MILFQFSIPQNLRSFSELPVNWVKYLEAKNQAFDFGCWQAFLFDKREALFQNQTGFTWVPKRLRPTRRKLMDEWEQ